MNTTTEKPTKKSAWLWYRRRLRFRIFKRDRFTCQYCGRRIVDGVQLTLDHIVPISCGGDYLAENLITACLSCNQGKDCDPLCDWMIQDLKREVEYLQVSSIIITV